MKKKNGILDRAKKSLFRRLVACTIGEGNGAVLAATGLGAATIFTGALYGSKIYNSTNQATTTISAKQNQATNNVGGGSGAR